MSLLSLDHSPWAYRLDFVLYALVCSAIAGTLLISYPRGSGIALLAWVAGGGALWSLLEYLLHRFVLHRIAPFSHWHRLHHLRPRALIATPIVLSLSLFMLLGTLPAWWLLGSWPAWSLTLGLVSGYLGYGLIHHAIHHATPRWIGQNAWISNRRRCHAMHHADTHTGVRGDFNKPCFFGVSSSFWDNVFGSNILVRPFRIEK